MTDFKNIKDFFAFTKSERIGLITLSTLIFLVILFDIFMPFFISKKKYDYTQFDKEVKSFLMTQKIVSENTSYNRKEEFDIYDANNTKNDQKLNPFPFDPNTITLEELQELGLTTRQITTLMNYRNKGGKYYKKKDFKKMYCISEKEYSILEPFIEIKLIPKTFESYDKKKEIDVPVVVELNSASEEELLKIKGIGPYFADKIIKYRILLGGYYQISQILEIPKMDSLKFKAIEAFINVNPIAIRKINVNSASFGDLKEHPYIGYNIALSLVNYRTKHGKYDQLIDIKSSALVSEKVFNKISHYLRVD
ncbi:MAG: helix-hairpin-helix domain-containing protein [Bacteroidota bacterium]